MYGSEPGIIKHIDRFKQVISFVGMERIRRITPTDIDGFIDYGGKFFIYMECKKDGKALDLGQRLALENVVKSHIAAGHKACAILFTHNTPFDEVIICKDAPVKSVFGVREGVGLGWYDITDNRTVIRQIEILENHWKVA